MKLGGKSTVSQYFDLLFIAFMVFQIKEFVSVYIFQKRAGGVALRKNALKILSFTSLIVSTQLIWYVRVKNINCASCTLPR